MATEEENKIIQILIPGFPEKVKRPNKKRRGGIFGLGLFAQKTANHPRKSPELFSSVHFDETLPKAAASKKERIKRGDLSESEKKLWSEKYAPQVLLITERALGIDKNEYESTSGRIKISEKLSEARKKWRFGVRPGSAAEKQIVDLRIEFERERWIKRNE